MTQQTRPEPDRSLAPVHAGGPPLDLADFSASQTLVYYDEPLFFVSGTGERLYLGFAAADDAGSSTIHFAVPASPRALVAFEDGRLTYGDLVALAGGTVTYTRDYFATSHAVKAEDMREDDRDILGRDGTYFASIAEKIVLPR